PPDGTVTGVALLMRSHSGESMHILKVVPRPGLPLQSTLFGMAQNAAQLLASRGVQLEVASSLSIHLLLLHDPVLHGSVADPQLLGVDTSSRAFRVTERDKLGVVFAPARSAEECLREAAQQARVAEPAAATVCTLRAIADLPRVSIGVAPQPVRGPVVRPP